MSATATAEIIPDTIQPLPTEPLSNVDLPSDIVEDAKAGLNRLTKMNPRELSRLIESRVNMLNGELEAREARRAAIAEASAAQKILDFRRARAQRIREKVNMGSSVMAAMFAGFIVATLI